MKKYTWDEWKAEGERRFGLKPQLWKFKCVRCGHVQTMEDFAQAGADPQGAYNSCIGRHVAGKGCDWALWGLFKLHEVVVVKDGSEIPVFEFADGVEL